MTGWDRVIWGAVCFYHSNNKGSPKMEKGEEVIVR